MDCLLCFLFFYWGGLFQFLLVYFILQSSIAGCIARLGRCLGKGNLMICESLKDVFKIYLWQLVEKQMVKKQSIIKCRILCMLGA